MSVPKKRRTNASVKRRASHFALSRKNLSVCPKCKSEMIPHRACPSCGYYAGREVIKMAVSKNKKSEKKEK